VRRGGGRRRGAAGRRSGGAVISRQAAGEVDRDGAAGEEKESEPFFLNGAEAGTQLHHEV
jgi:hypothetical protein